MDKMKLVGIIVAVVVAVASIALGMDVKKLVCESPVAAEAAK